MRSSAEFLPNQLKRNVLMGSNEEPSSIRTTPAGAASAGQYAAGLPGGSPLQSPQQAAQDHEAAASASPAKRAAAVSMSGTSFVHALSAQLRKATTAVPDAEEGTTTRPSSNDDIVNNNGGGAANINDHNVVDEGQGVQAADSTAHEDEDVRQKEHEKEEELLLGPELQSFIISDQDNTESYASVNTRLMEI